MGLNVSTSTIVMERSSTTGVGPYVLSALGGFARFGEFYSAGESVPYAADNGGSLAEFGVGIMLSDGTIQRPSVMIWSSNGGARGGPIDWPAGRRLVRALVDSSGPGGVAAVSAISGFWPGTVTGNTAIGGHLFVDAGTLPQNLAGSRALAGTPVAASGGEMVVDEFEEQLVDENGATVDDGTTGGVRTVFSLSKNAVPIGSLTFDPGDPQGKFSFAADQAFAAGDLLMITAPAIPDGTLADLTWTLKRTS